jgi:sirohydrochlorin ferrochelatase
MRTALLALAAASALAAAPAAERAPLGILLLAHGGNAEWNGEIAAIARSLDAETPTETALGMAELPALQAAVDRLERRGVGRIVAVPLFVHSRSEVLDQTRYNLGLRERPSEVLRDAMAAMTAAHAHAGHGAAAHAHHGAHHAGGREAAGGHSMSFSLERVRTTVPLTMTAALDDSAAVGDIVTRRARALSRDARRETVLLVAHGPVDEPANEAWLSTMRVQAARVRKAGKFRAAQALTIRDDAKPEVKKPALAALRRAVAEASRDGGRAIVVPYLIARGGIEHHITQALEGLEYAWDGRTLCPDPAIRAWAASRAAEAARELK